MLELEHNELSGSIPTELGGLALSRSNNSTMTHLLLQSLLLNGNRFTGTIPSELGQLTQLTALKLHHNPYLEANQVMPQEICGLQDPLNGVLETISVDCDIVDCKTHGCKCECIKALD
jgi:hypothetical protein